MKKGLRIEEQSFEIITKIMKNIFYEQEMPIVQRIIHATGDFEFEDIIRFHPEAIKKGINAIKTGKNILVDVKMVEAGINKRKLLESGGKVYCYISDHDVEDRAKEEEKTRAEISIEKAVNNSELRDNIGIIAIGNAPTALLKVMELIEDDKFHPDLIIGVPVGFVKAEESKDILSKKRYPFITSLGRKGGSPVAVAIVNGLIKLAAL